MVSAFKVGQVDVRVPHNGGEFGEEEIYMYIYIYVCVCVGVYSEEVYVIRSVLW